ncbi:MAG: hypothetical protein IT174_05620 [Acidobacteria bacterium]|nr:hypothetical protein [Acidobacteriota bacterium]
MADKVRKDYDTSIGTKERSVVSATKLWGIVIAVVVLIGVLMLVMFFTSNSSGLTNGQLRPAVSPRARS